MLRRHCQHFTKNLVFRYVYHPAIEPAACALTCHAWLSSFLRGYEPTCHCIAEFGVLEIDWRRYHRTCRVCSRCGHHILTRLCCSDAPGTACFVRTTPLCRGLKLLYSSAMVNLQMVIQIKCGVRNNLTRPSSLRNKGLTFQVYMHVLVRYSCTVLNALSSQDGHLSRLW